MSKFLAFIIRPLTFLAAVTAALIAYLSRTA
jgi:hypothetical protein